MTRIGKGIAGFLLAFAFSVSAAALVSVQSSLDRDRVGVGEGFVYTVTVLSDQAVDIQTPRPPDLQGFELVDTWDATAVSQKLMPGPRGMEFQTQRRREFSYRLRALREGRHTIGAFDIVVDGKNHATQPVVLEVAATPQGRSGGGHQAPSQGMPPGFPSLDDLDSMDRAEEELFRQLLQRRNPIIQRPQPQHRTLPINPNEAFFVQVEVDKTEVYEGEQVTVSWYVYTRGQMETLDRVKFPDLKGFWKEIIEEVPTIQFSEEIVNGIPYRKALLASHALFPIKSGTAVIDEYKIKSRVRLPVQGLGGFAYGKPYEFTKSSQRVSIKVKPLPTEGRPSDFTGAVGAFDVNAATDASSVPSGQPFNLRVRFQGSGNAKGIELPAIDWPKTVEIYDTKAESRFFKNGSSYKEFNVLIIPRQEGDLEIPSFSVSMFDPSQGKYYSRSTAPVKLKVTEGNQTSGQGSQRLAESSPTPSVPRQGLPDPVVAFRTVGAGAGFFNRSVVWAALYLSVFLALAFKAKLELGERSRKRDLKAILAKRFKEVDKTAAAGDWRRTGTEMANVFSIVLGEVAGETGASQEISKVLERISPSLRRDFGVEIEKRHEVFQTLAFAPEEALGDLKSPDRLKKEIEQAKTLLNRIVKNVTENENENV